MKIKMFSVQDSKADAYLEPFFSQTTETAIRSFTEAANSTDHHFYKYAADYTLFELGVFDQETGDYEKLVPNKNLGNALTWKENA